MRPLHYALTALTAATLLVTTVSAQERSDYQYDSQGQLVSVRKTGAQTTYTYDQAGNRTALESRSLFPILQSWEAEDALFHETGYPDGEGWSGSPSSAAGLLTYGPYATNTPVGDNVAVWKMMRQPSALPAGQQVVVLSIFDTSQLDVVASRSITLADWPVASRWDYFTLPFTLPASRRGHYLEFYTNYTPSTHVKVDRIGLALPTPMGVQAGVATMSWEAEGASLGHATGFAEADGWAANTASTGSFLTYGPYVSSLAVGERTALWTMMIDDNVGDEGPVVRLDVYDATQGDVITDRTLTRQAWALTNQYQTFGIPFTLDAARAGHAIEFRTFFWPRAHVRIDKIGAR